jgi:hypothetical protein
VTKIAIKRSLNPTQLQNRLKVRTKTIPILNFFLKLILEWTVTKHLFDLLSVPLAGLKPLTLGLRVEHFTTVLPMEQNSLK